MQVQLIRSPFLQTLKNLHSVLNKQSLPILQHLLLESDGATLTATATDLELTDGHRLTLARTEEGTRLTPTHLHTSIPQITERTKQVVEQAISTQSTPGSGVPEPQPALFEFLNQQLLSAPNAGHTNQTVQEGSTRQ